MKFKKTLIKFSSLFYLFVLIIPCQMSHAYSRVEVYLDPGHGGEDTGAIIHESNSIFTEKELTLSIAKKTREFLKKKNIKTYLTREEDEVVPLDSRTAFTQKRSKIKGVKPVFVSIHLNSNSDISASGIETYVFNASTNEASSRLAEVENGSFRVHQKGVLGMILSDLTASASYADSVSLACAVQRSLILETQDLRDSNPLKNEVFKNRGVKKGLFYVLMDAQAPSILIELGFLSNPEERKALDDAKVQSKIAKALAEGIVNWIYPKNRDAIQLAASGILKGPRLKDYVQCR